MSKAGFTGQLQTRRPAGFFYRDQTGAETMSIPRWLVFAAIGIFLVLLAIDRISGAIYNNSVLYKLEAVEAYQAATQAKCAQAFGAQQGAQQGALMATPTPTPTPTPKR